MPRSADSLPVLACLATTPEHFWQQEKKKKKKNAIWRISHFHSCSVIFFLLSAVVQPWSSHSGENREKWKQGYVFFLPCVETLHSQRWTQWSSSWSVLWKQNNILIMAQWHIISAANSNYFTIWNSDCWIFPWGWLNHKGDCGEAPSRCQAPESTVQPIMHFAKSSFACACLGFVICKLFNSLQQKFPWSREQGSVFWDKIQAAVSSLWAAYIALAAMN